MSEPLLVQKLSTQLSYLNQRQKLIAQNIANVDTPGFKAQDLKKINFDDMASSSSNRIELESTNPKHLASANKDGPFSSAKDRAHFEKKLLGNNIVLDEQMGKISDVGAQSQLATTLLHKYNQLYRTAIDNKG